MTVSSPQTAMLAARLEDILVAEFRAYGELVTCAREERAHLTNGAVADLVALLEQKEKIVGELNRLEQRRATVLLEWESGPVPTLTELLPKLEAPLAERVSRLREGILVLVERERDLARGNRLLATAALERTEALRAFLINQTDPLEGYRPPGKHAVPTATASLIAEHWA